REREQTIIQGDYCRPVGNTAKTASHMCGLNRRLDLVAAARARGVRLVKEMLGASDHWAVPEIRVLAFEGHISAGGVVPRRATTGRVEHQRQQTFRLRLVRKQ